MFYFSRVYLSFWVSVCLYFDVSGCKNFLLTKVYFCHLFTHLLLSCLEWCVLVFSSAFLCAIADIVRFFSLHEISIDLQSFELVCNVCDWVWVYRKWMRVCVGYAVVVFHHLADAIAVFSVMLVSRDLFSGCFVSLMSSCLFSFALSHSITCHFLSFLRTCIFILKICFPLMHVAPYIRLYLLACVCSISHLIEIPWSVHVWLLFARYFIWPAIESDRMKYAFIELYFAHRMCFLWYLPIDCYWTRSIYTRQYKTYTRH